MNLQWYNILAADDDGLINMLVLVVLVVMGLIGHVIKKAQEKKQVEEADRKVEEAKRRHAATKHASEGTQQTKPLLSPPGPAASGAGEKQHIPVIHAAKTLGQGVGQEVVQVRKQLAAKEMQQRKRLAPSQHLQPTVVAATMPAEHVGQDGPKIHLNLTNPKTARAAIICAEIMGLPKALRSNPEPWDM